MKTEFADVNETRKTVRVEIPTDIVNAEIDRIAQDYSRKARIPGFRPGKAPARVIKQRFKEQILHDVLHDLVPRAVDDALREKGVEAVDTPDVRDVNIEEGQPLTFTASFDTVPTFDPGDLSTISLRRAKVGIDDEAVAGALQRLRDRAARFEAVEGRGLDHGDSATVDLVRRDLGKRDAGDAATAGAADERPAAPATGPGEKHDGVSIELGAKANPPGFDEQLLGLNVGDAKEFTTPYPRTTRWGARRHRRLV
jgi:trigger factor